MGLILMPKAILQRQHVKKHALSPEPVHEETAVVELLTLLAKSAVQKHRPPSAMFKFLIKLARHADCAEENVSHIAIKP